MNALIIIGATGSAKSKCKRFCDFRLWLLADIPPCEIDVRFSPKTGRQARRRYVRFRIGPGRQTNKLIQAVQILLLKEAPWLADFQHELVTFPNGRHDVQVDSVDRDVRARGLPAPTRGGCYTIAGGVIPTFLLGHKIEVVVLVTCHS